MERILYLIFDYVRLHKKHKDYVTLLTLGHGIYLSFFIPDINIFGWNGVSVFVSFSPIYIRKRIKHNVFVKQNAHNIDYFQRWPRSQVQIS